MTSKELKNNTLVSNDLRSEFIKWREISTIPAGATFRLIEINGLNLAVLKCRAQQKRHRPYSHSDSYNSMRVANLKVLATSKQIDICLQRDLVLKANI
jgi:hypothetical protein